MIYFRPKEKREDIFLSYDIFDSFQPSTVLIYVCKTRCQVPLLSLTHTNPSDQVFALVLIFVTD